MGNAHLSLAVDIVTRPAPTPHRISIEIYMYYRLIGTKAETSILISLVPFSYTMLVADWQPPPGD